MFRSRLKTIVTLALFLLFCGKHVDSADAAHLTTDCENQEPESDETHEGHERPGRRQSVIPTILWSSQSLIISKYVAFAASACNLEPQHLHNAFMPKDGRYKQVM